METARKITVTVPGAECPLTGYGVRVTPETGGGYRLVVRRLVGPTAVVAAALSAHGRPWAVAGLGRFQNVRAIGHGDWFRADCAAFSVCEHAAFLAECDGTPLAPAPPPEPAPAPPRAHTVMCLPGAGSLGGLVAHGVALADTQAGRLLAVNHLAGAAGEALNFGATHRPTAPPRVTDYRGNDGRAFAFTRLRFVTDPEPKANASTGLREWVAAYFAFDGVRELS